MKSVWAGGHDMAVQLSAGPMDVQCSGVSGFLHIQGTAASSLARKIWILENPKPGRVCNYFLSPQTGSRCPFLLTVSFSPQLYKTEMFPVPLLFLPQPYVWGRTALPSASASGSASSRVTVVLGIRSSPSLINLTNLTKAP